MFTPGPWKIQDGRIGLVVTRDDSVIIAACTGGADAALIATAPEMYEMLRDLRARFAGVLSDSMTGVGANSTCADINRLLHRAEGIARG